MGLFDTAIHRWLRIPYSLHVRKKRLRKSNSVTYIFIHGLGDTGELWDPLLKKLPENVNYVTLDLLGFGDSKKPEWARYNTTVQARSLLMTYTRLRIAGDVVIIGHSLGGLVAVEFARRYPLHAKKLVLCSPPIYDSEFSPKTRKIHQDTLTHLYKDLSKNPSLVMNAYAIGRRLRIINQSLKVTPETLPAFMSSLQASIVNQNTLKLIGGLELPIVIIDGAFDVLTIHQVLQDIAKNNENIQLITINASHTINNTYIGKILKVLNNSRQK